ncbi:hypothetical protein BUALT_Bualt07G0016000 [Buddleja alternifolia]|uniref:Transposase n=1 Tax=Buddleja alternifolia TaxID=168488 RepID=A0AAV6X735_9LAMI|nr:hypothetical protein BUALT_Bualt07G0016000 [Buddleja alternifolia]
MIVKFDFWRSEFTISVHFHAVLNAILKLRAVFLVKPKPVNDNCNNPRRKPFKGCLGALDRSYIDVQVLKAHKLRYRTCKGSIGVNVLGVVDQDMKFVYVLPGWERSAADSRVLHDAMSRPNGLRVPTACTTMLPSSSNISKSKGTRAFANRCGWTPHEEEVLIDSIKGMLANGWKADNGFRFGYLNHLADEMMKMFPGTNIRIILLATENVVKNKEKTAPINVPSPGLDGQNDFNHDIDEDETTSVGQSMCSMPASSSTSKQSNKGKRKIMEGLEPIVEALDKFTEKTYAKLSELTDIISHEFKLSTKKEVVYQTVAGIEDLTLQEKLVASNMIVKNHEVLELFFTLPDAAR